MQVCLRQEHEPRHGASLWTFENRTDCVVILLFLGRLSTGKLVEQLSDVGSGHVGVGLHAADGEGTGFVLGIGLPGLGRIL